MSWTGTWFKYPVECTTRSFPMRIPQDIANLLAAAIRDVIWFKRSVLAFLEECDVPAAILVEAHHLDRDNTPTIRIIRRVLERLSEKGDDGAYVLHTLLTRMYCWRDVHTLPRDRTGQAVASLKAFHQGYELYEAQRKYQQEQDRQTRAGRRERVAMNPPHHAELQALRDEFDTIHSIESPQERGDRFQDLMNRLFDCFCEESNGMFNRTGDQMKGLFRFDGHWHYVQVVWEADQAGAADTSVLHHRARNAHGGEAMALLISLNGFSPECIRNSCDQPDERVILMDGYDLRCVLDCQIDLDVLLAEKQLAVLRDKKRFTGARDIIQRRRDAK